MEKGHIFIVDDDAALVRTLGKTLALEGYATTLAETGEEALGAFLDTPFRFDLALLDLRLPDIDGHALMSRLLGIRPDLPCVVITAFGTVQRAVEAMRGGAFDFLLKPFPRETLLSTIARALERNRLLRENRLLKEQLRDTQKEGEVSTRSPTLARLLEMLRQVAPTDTTVLLTGETGTGKERVAGLVHGWSQRAERPFLKINCAALAENLLESQLFGHVKGAFTGADEARNGLFREVEEGTLFLDEIGDISPTLQVKLLRVLQEGEFLPVGATRPEHTDVRIIAATNRDLDAEVAAGRFRQDLYYRLNVFGLKLPPLRERREDLPALAQTFVAQANQRIDKAVVGLTRSALDDCLAYGWPGNIRELRNVIERAVILCSGEWIGPEHLSFSPAPRPARHTEFAWPAESRALWQIEKAYIEELLRRTGWRKSASARILGISRKTLDRKIHEYDLRVEGLR